MNTMTLDEIFALTDENKKKEELLKWLDQHGEKVNRLQNKCDSIMRNLVK